MRKLPTYLVLLVTGALSALLMVQYLRLLKPAQARAVTAACNGMRPAPSNQQLGPLERPVPAPDFEALAPDGSRVSLADFRGEVVIVNFWSSWCNVCRSEKPSLERFQRDTDGVTVLALASDRDWPSVWKAVYGFQVSMFSKLDDAHRQRVTLPPNTSDAVVVSRVDPGRPASDEGLDLYDVVTDANGILISSLDDLHAVLAESPPSLSLKLWRNGRARRVDLEPDTSLRVLLDPPTDDGNLGAIARRYGITAVPESFVIDREGLIRHYFINKRDWDSDVAVTCIRDLLAE